MKEVILVILCLLPVFACQARIIIVDDNGVADFHNIQAAIVDANDGDTVIVADGTYTGGGNHDIPFLGKAIVVRSQNGPESTVVDCQGMGNGFGFVYGEDANSVLDGFTVKNGYSLKGGGIICGKSSPTIKNCIITGNRAKAYGGAMYMYGASSPLLINCTIVDNITIGAVIPRHGGIFGGSPIVTNCIVWGNRAYGTHDVEENQIDGDTPGINYSCVEGWSGDLGGVGNFGADPWFVEQGFWDSRIYYQGDYHLLPDSLCVNAGDPNFVPELDAKDADGEPRVMGDRVDIGADEVGPKRPDLSRNGAINSEDIAIFSNSWLAEPTDDNWYILSDFHRDDFIGFADLGLLTDDWLWQAPWHTPE